MNRFLALTCALVALFSSVAAAPQLEPPPEGKAVVYIGRMTGMVGRMRPFHFFEGQSYLARVKGKNYVRYVGDPGEHTFWVAADGRNFIKADLEAGRSYAVWAKITSGTWTAGASLVPIAPGSKAWKEFHKMIRNTKPTRIDPEYIAKWEEGHPDYIDKVMTEWKAAGEPALTMRADEFFE